MLKTKLFKYCAVLVLIMGALSAAIAIHLIHGQTIKEAQRRVQLDLNTAWAIMRYKIRELEAVTKHVAVRNAFLEDCEKQDWKSEQLRRNLAQVKAHFNLSFLAILTPEGVAAVRGDLDGKTEKSLAYMPDVRKAMTGESSSGIRMFSAGELADESASLSAVAHVDVEATPHAGPTQRRSLDDGLMLVSSVPMFSGRKLVAVLLGGVLLNHNTGFADELKKNLYTDETYKGVDYGTATIFLDDTRITTTVRKDDGSRAIGTRVSEEVAGSVLRNGKPWVGRAFVVKDWYLTAYDPIRDDAGRIVGMLYVGVLEKPFLDLRAEALVRYLWLSLAALGVALALAFVLAGKLARPLMRLVQASHAMAEGREQVEVPVDHAACRETETLICAFNRMSATLAQRTENLRATNKSYMEALGFVSHELKNPLGSVVNYVYLLRERMMGDLNEKQMRAVTIIESNVTRIREMIKHYLNLSRIESGTLVPRPARLSVASDVVNPLLQAFEAQFKMHGITVANAVPPDAATHSDLNMTMEIFENLISNALKYGKAGGAIRLDGAQKDGYWRFSVYNDGQGIAREDMDRLFGKFVRLDSASIDGKAKGSGLGLFITKKIVEAHGGTMEVRSEPGKYAEFEFSLPAWPQDLHPAAPGRKEDNP